MSNALINVCQGFCCRRFYLQPNWRDVNFSGRDVALAMVVQVDATHYTCRHLNYTNMRCNSYLGRPQFCRTYPEGSPCEYDCAYHETREDAYTKWWLDWLVSQWKKLDDVKEGPGHVAFNKS